MISQNNFVVLEVKQNLRRYWLMAWDIISAAIKTFFDRVPNFNISSFQNLFLRWRLNRSFWGKVRMILAAPDNMPMTPNILGSVCCISQIPNNWGLGFFISQIPKLKISDIWSKLCEFREFSTIDDHDYFDFVFCYKSDIYIITENLRSEHIFSLKYQHFLKRFKLLIW